MPPRHVNFQSEDERRQYQRDYRRRQKENMDDTEKEKQRLLYNEKWRERYARKRQHMMDIEINNEHKFLRSTSNLGSLTISKQYRPSEV